MGSTYELVQRQEAHIRHMTLQKIDYKLILGNTPYKLQVFLFLFHNTTSHSSQVRQITTERDRYTRT